MVHLFISVDTGPIYIAEAFNVPTVDIVGPVDENVQPPADLFTEMLCHNETRPNSLYLTLERMILLKLNGKQNQFQLKMWQKLLIN